MKKFSVLTLAMVFSMALISPLKTAQARPDVSPLANVLITPKSKTALTVTSSRFANNQAIPAQFSKDGENLSLPIAWSKGPNGTKSYALLIEDPDAPAKILPIIHWAVWNIPTDTRSLPQGLDTSEILSAPKGARQGVNVSGGTGYTGPHPPAGDKPHHYHIQIFAVDRMLDLKADATRDDLIDAMKGHVLAMGELIGTFAQ